MKISIIIPVFNRPELLIETLNSIIEIKDSEVIVIDDGSSKENAKKQKEAAEKIGAVYKFQNNAGLSSARNEGIKASNGDYIFFLDSDDIVTNEFVEWINKENLVDDIYRFNYIKGIENGKKINVFPMSCKHVSHFDSFNGAQISTYLFKRSIIENIRFRSSYSEDRILRAELRKTVPSKRWRVIKVNSIKYRIDNTSITRSGNMYDKLLEYYRQNGSSKYHLAECFVFWNSFRNDYRRNSKDLNDVEKVNKLFNNTNFGGAFYVLSPYFKFVYIKYKFMKLFGLRIFK